MNLSPHAQVFPRVIVDERGGDSLTYTPDSELDTPDDIFYNNFLVVHPVIKIQTFVSLIFLCDHVMM